jgi:hypothetical protein
MVFFIEGAGFSWTFNRVIYEWMDLGFVLLAGMLKIGIWRYGWGQDHTGLERGCGAASMY